MTDAKQGSDAFHDGVLLGLDLRWAEGTAHMRIRTATGAKHLVIRDVKQIECSREFPWGRSVCINELRIIDTAPGEIRLEVEMQSGDVLRIRGSSAEEQDAVAAS